MKPIGIILVLFVLLLASILIRQVHGWQPLAQLTQALSAPVFEDRAGRPINQR